MSEWTAQEDRRIDVLLYNIIVYIHKELIMKNLITLFIIIVISLVQIFLKSWTIQIRIMKKTKKNAEGRPDLFSEIVCRNELKKMKHNDIQFYAKACNIIEEEMRHRAKSGYNMNEEFGYEIARMRAQTDCENDSLNIIGFSLATVNFVQNICSILENEMTQSNKIRIIAMNILAMVIYLLFLRLHPSGKEDDKKRIVCVEILERIEKSEDFSSPCENFPGSADETSNAVDEPKDSVGVEK